MENFEKTNELALNTLKQQLEGAGIDTFLYGVLDKQKH